MPMPAPITLIDPSRTKTAGTRRGTREIVAAFSADDVWAYEHGEESSTPWHIRHVPTGRWFQFAAPTLKAARYLTANESAWLLAEMDRRAALVAMVAKAVAA